MHVYLEGADLRYVAFNGSELIRRVYMAVRDLAWGTVPHSIVHREIVADDGRFRVRAELLHRHAQVAVSSEIEIHGHENGSIEYVMRARALESFELAKIGLNIYHPIAGLVGRRWRGISSHGEWSGVIPKPIHPQIHLRTEGWDLPIFPPVHELWLDHAVGVLRFDFSGRAYEMEDHRNWSDQSLKTYSMPAETGYQHQIAKNDELAEHLRVSFSPHAAHSRRRGRRVGPLTVSVGRIRVGTPLGRRMPTIGLIQAGPLRESAAHLIELIHPAHLRLEVDLAAPDWGDHLAAELDACARIGAAAELALFLVRDPRVPLTHLGEIVRERGAPVSRVLAFVRDEDATPPSWTDLVRESLTVEASIGGGAHMNFAELNRAWPDMRGFDVVAYPLSPQVHATSDLSLIENLEAQGEQVWTARRRVGRRALAVGPVTVEPRWRSDPWPRMPVRSAGD